MSHQPLPAGPISAHRGRGLPLPGADIDTDRIIPARFLKCVTFENLATGVFADDRSERSGDHPFDRDEHQGASVLVVNRNFGCGSSREHAPQALMRWGIRALVGESFAEIFFGNCLALGLPCLTADPAHVAELQEAIAVDPGAELLVDLEAMEVVLESEFAGDNRWPVTLDPGPRRMLLTGHWDGTSQLLAHDAELSATAAVLPYLSGFR
ncbi:3-isopropylmalate dehydratase small subunit 2 [Cyanobium sp. CH-040]|uniref:3-isopropylmalate dehydratase small subunit n=1 Tax=Cyanobium sp. CH-040 TaxID=2823708 RepID=UPI0020CE0FED|nr:3-isopropylmalate dehydratase small subunit [Cyanobium sp. CH-040]MCP9927372.1 3-isopropylmalate dehydratase small subunit [Cyanobium sp. CH-040]